MTKAYQWKGGKGDKPVAHQFQNARGYFCIHADDFQEVALRVNVHEPLVAAMELLVDRDAAVVGSELRLNFASHAEAFQALQAAREAVALAATEWGVLKSPSTSTTTTKGEGPCK